MILTRNRPLLMFTLQWLMQIVYARFDIYCGLDSQVYPDWVTVEPCYEQQILDVYIFGDSYSDNGQPIQDEKYYQEHYFPDRYSNGPMCIEYIVKMLGANLFNYAYSGATIDNSIVHRNTLDIHQQLQMFRQKGGPRKLSDTTLYTFWIGTNDVEEIFKSQTSTALRNLYIDRSLDSLYTALEDLYHMPSSSMLSNHNARQFLVMGLIPVDYMPVVSSLITYEYERKPMSDLVERYNRGLEELVKRFNQQYTDAEVYYYDTHWISSQFFRSGNRLFSTVYSPCKIGQDICSDEERHLWWDDYHPTTMASYMIAVDMYRTLFV